MKQLVKAAGLSVIGGAGVFSAVARSKWRRDRLLIWCFHGVSLRDEHEWQPALFLSPRNFEERLRFFERSGFEVVPLGEGLRRLGQGASGKPAVALTFDDGFYDFYAQAAPLLKRYSCPSTVYLTTYYAQRRIPVANLVVPYMLWKRRGAEIRLSEQAGLPAPMELARDGHESIAAAIEAHAAARGLNGAERIEQAERLAAELGLDWADILESRILQIMTMDEAADLSRRGFDIELHTHRHRTPDDERLYTRELEENRAVIREATGKTARHFCYPSGVWKPQVHPWLRAADVETATTCEHGIATADSDPLALPRYVDRNNLTPAEMRAWASGFFALVKDRG